MPLREYLSLGDLLTYETSVKDPHETAEKLIEMILESNPDFEILVIFIGNDPIKPWMLFPIPSEAMKTLADAELCIGADGRVPAAFWRRN